MTAPHPILIDTDPGIDDAMALLFLRARPEVRIAAITTVFGNADVETTTRNAGYLAERFGIKVPVIAGAARPLHIERLISPTQVHGVDGLGDVLTLPSVHQSACKPTAAQSIVDAVHSMPHQLSLLALGPLTNLALALQLDPTIAGLVRRVVVMGGAFGWHGRRGNISPLAEANIRNDPHAANLVLAANWPITMVGLDVTERCVISTEDAQRLANHGGEAGRLLWDISRGYETLYKQVDGLAGCCLHDVAAAACLVDPTLFMIRRGSIRVEMQGAAIGQTIMYPAVLADDSQPPEQQACYDVDVARLMNLYEQTIAAGPSRGRSDQPGIERAGE